MDDLVPKKSRKRVDARYQDFKFFLGMCWSRFIRGAPLPTRVQLDIADFLQHGGQNICVMAMRGIGKTHITAAFCVWTLLWHPNYNIVVVSKTLGHAKNVTTWMKKIVESMPVCSHMKPKEEDRKSSIAFDLSGGGIRVGVQPSVVAVGIEGQIQGLRADVIIADDIETKENSATDVGRALNDDRTGDFVNVCTDKHARQVFLGTPQNYASMYTRTLPRRQFTIRAWPMLYPDQGLRDHLGKWLAPIYTEDLAMNPLLVGHAIDSRLDDETARKRMTKGEDGEEGDFEGISTFNLQNQLDTRVTDENRFPLKLRDFKVADLNKDVGPERILWDRERPIPELPSVGIAGDCWYYGRIEKDVKMAPYTGAVMTVDPSGDGKDETGYTITKTLNGEIFLLDAGGFLEGYSETTMNGLADVAKFYGVHLVIYDGAGGYVLFGDAIKPHLRARFSPTWQCAIADIREHMPWNNSRQKEVRNIELIAPALQQHRITVDRAFIERDARKSHPGRSVNFSSKYQLLYQLTHLTRDPRCLAHDDELDALGMAIGYWRHVLALSGHEIAATSQKQRDELHERRLAATWANLRRLASFEPPPPAPNFFGRLLGLSRELQAPGDISKILGR